MGNAIINFSQRQKQAYYTATESPCTAVKRNLREFTENLLPPFMISRYVKLFMKALNHLDEVARIKQEKEHRNYFDGEPVSFLLHEASQSIQSIIKNTCKNSSESTTPEGSDIEGD